MTKIRIKKSPMADTRSCEVSTVSKEQLLQSSKLHIIDVRNGMAFLSACMKDQADRHDYTKLSAIDHFYADFQTGFKEHGWWDMHKTTERHHLAEGASEDVNLIDVIEYLVDCITAGKARSGVVYPVKIDSSILQRAFDNTVKMVTDEIEVVE